MRPNLILLALLLICAGVAEARLAETPAQVEARYGPPAKCNTSAFAPADVVNLYKANGYSIIVAFQNDASVLEMFSKTDNGEISQEELAQLKAANSYGMNWNKLEDTTGESWRRSDSSAVASLDLQKKSLTFTVQYFIERVAAARREAAKKSLAGF